MRHLIIAQLLLEILDNLHDASKSVTLKLADILRALKCIIILVRLGHVLGAALYIVHYN